MKNVFLYVHSHWDREWYREFEEFRLRLIEVVDDVINKLQTNELPSFYFDGQTAALEDYLEIYPKKEADIKKLIAEKKLFIGPFYCSADSFLVSAEFMLRNLCIGKKYSQKFGCNDFLGYLSDTFGHSASMPEILKSSGIEHAILWRGLGSLPSEFVWQGLQTTYLLQGYFQDIFSLNIDFDKKAQLLEKFIDRIAERSSDNILLPCGADHLKVADMLSMQVKEINNRLKNYNLKISSPFDYLKAVKNNYKIEQNSEFLDQSKNFLLKGVYSSRIYQKRQNAACQWALSRICEPTATIFHALGHTKNWQNEIDYAYKNLIKNHAHDSIYGCSTDEVHKDVERRFAQNKQITNGITKRVIRDVTQNTDEISILNLSNFNYSGTVEIETEKNLSKKYKAQLISTRKGFTDKKLFNPNEIPVTEDIKTIKKYLIEVEDLKPFSISNSWTQHNKKHSISNKLLENNYIKLEVKNNQIRLKNKDTNEIYENFIEIIDRADVGDSYNFGALKNDMPINAQLVSTKILQQGPIKSTLRLIYEIAIPATASIKNSNRSKKKIKHKITLDVSLSNLAKHLEFKLNWINKAQNHILQVKFNFKKPIIKTFSEDAIGLTERTFDPNYDIYNLVPAAKGIELKTNTAPMQRFVWAQNVGLITKGLNEYEINKKSLNITVLRATGLISEPQNPTRGTPAGPPLACKDLQCLGQNYAEFCVTFTSNPKELYKTAETFYGCTIPFFGGKIKGNFCKINNPNILIQALKSNENHELIFRLVNISNTDEYFEFEPPKKFANIFITNSCEETIEEVNKKIFKISAKGLLTIKCSK